MRGHQKLQHVKGLLIGALAVVACAEGPTGSLASGTPEAFLAKGGGGTAVTVTVADQAVGVAADGDPFSITIPSGGVLDIRPSCSTPGKRLRLVGMEADLGSLGARSTCNGSNGKGFVFLKPLVNTSTPDGACPGQNAPQQTANGWNFGVTNRYFFQVDSDGDGKFDDQQYTIVLTNCTIAGRQVTASTGDLYAGQSGTPIASGITINVDLTF